MHFVTDPNLLHLLRESAKYRQPEPEPIAVEAPIEEPEDAIEPEPEAPALATLSASSPAPNRCVQFLNLLLPEWSWDLWRAIGARLDDRLRELWACIGRGAGKTMFIAAGIVCERATRGYPRRPGETIYAAVASPDKRQSRVLHGYVLGLLRSVPALDAMIVQVTKDTIVLSNGVTIEIVTGNAVAPRGKTYCVFVIEEACFLRSEDSASPDVELLRAVRPALARCPGSLLAVISSPYAKKGIMYAASEKYGDGHDPRVLYVQGSTLDLNPLFDREAIEAALADDPAAARSEYLGLFRDDLESYVSIEVVKRCIRPEPIDRPRLAGVRYVAFFDMATGLKAGGDSFAYAIGHREQRNGQGVVIIDCLREVRPPFDPSDAIRQCAEVFKAYGCRAAISDKWAGPFPGAEFLKHGIRVTQTAQAKTDLYRAVLPMLNAATIELPEHPRMLVQWTALERRVGASGRDVVDHPRGGHDDIVNVCAGVADELTREAMKARPGVF